MQGFVPFIGNAADRAAHNGAEHVIDCPNDILSAAEIIRQRDGHGVRTVRLIRGKGILFLQKAARVCHAEAVNALLHVAHKKEVRFVIIRKTAVKLCLNGVGVLIFVHHHRVIPCRHLTRDCRFLSAFIAQQAQSQMLKIAVFERFFLHFRLIEQRFKALCGACQSAKQRGNARTVGGKFFFGAEKDILLQAVQNFLCLLAQSFDRFFCAFVRPFYRTQPGGCIALRLNGGAVPPALIDQLFERNDKGHILL